MEKRNWNQIRADWFASQGVTFEQFCQERGLPIELARRHYRGWVREVKRSLSDVIREAQGIDIESAERLGQSVREAVNLIDAADLKNLKEVSGILNQLSATRKNIFNYLPEDRERNVDWTRSLSITCDQDDAL
jgi:hypothetical protein